MSGEALKKIELRTAQEVGDGMFYYLGFNPMPKRNMVIRSIANIKRHVPIHDQHNPDGSLTLQFYRHDFTDMGTRNTPRIRESQQDRFLNFVTETVLPQLMEAAGCEVDWSGQLAVVELPPNRLSLFAPDLEPVFNGQLDSARH